MLGLASIEALYGYCLWHQKSKLTIEVKKATIIAAYGNALVSQESVKILEKKSRKCQKQFRRN